MYTLTTQFPHGGSKTFPLKCRISGVGQHAHSNRHLHLGTICSRIGEHLTLLTSGKVIFAHPLPPKKEDSIKKIFISQRLTSQHDAEARRANVIIDCLSQGNNKSRERYLIGADRISQIPYTALESILKKTINKNAEGKKFKIKFRDSKCLTERTLCLVIKKKKDNWEVNCGVSAPSQSENKVLKSSS